MKIFRFFCKIITITIFSGLALAHATEPVWTFSPVVGYPPSITLSPGESKTVKYTVTNQSPKPHLLMMLPIKGITASGCTSTLEYLQQCTLSLQVNANALNKNISGGPVLCERKNPNQCYRPTKESELQIKLINTPLPTPPGAPTNITVLVGNGAALISWTAPANDGGSPITSYTVTSSPGNQTCTTSSGTVTSCIVEGLSNDTNYTFAVQASNAQGSGTVSLDSPQITPLATIPTQPTDVIASAGDKSATVNWTAPTDTGGSAIVNYTVTSAPGNQTCTTSGSATSCTITGLTNGSSYTFTVTATNTEHTGLPSQPSNQVTPASVPNAPTNVIASSGNASATVNWTAPNNNGGSAITGYMVKSSPGNYTCTTSSATNTSCIVAGLTNGTSYTFTVVAKNFIGDSVESAPSTPVIPATVPDAPTNVNASPGNASATINWTAPSNNGGSAITGYMVKSSSGNHSCTTSSATNTSCTVTGLTNGISYTFTVIAKNLIGNSSESAPSTPVTPATVPNAPTNVIGTPGNTSATLSWTAPSNNGGSPITGYLVRDSSGAHTCTTSSVTNTSCTVTGLINGTNYTFTVVAQNLIGNSSGSTPPTSVTPVFSETVPDAPTNVSATPGNKLATISWTAPSNDGGSPITSYTVTSSPDNQTCTTSSATDTSCTVNGLTNGTGYTFTVVATNNMGNSLPSNASNEVIPSGVPDAPTGVNATPGDKSATINWMPPSDDGGSAITGYTVTSTPDNQTCTTTSATDTSCTVIGLTNGTGYTFTVIATNNNGNSLPSDPSNEVIPVGVPQAPSNLNVIPGNGTITISWDMPNDEGSPILEYTVSYASGDTGIANCQFAQPNDTQCIVSGLTRGTDYSFTIRATNAQGTSPESDASTSTTPLSVPTAPLNVNANLGPVGSQTITINWDSPSDDGGVPSTGYQVVDINSSIVLCTTNQTSCTASNLSIGTAYSFIVTASNQFGTSPPSNTSNSLTPIGFPTNIAVLSGSNQNMTVGDAFNNSLLVKATDIADQPVPGVTINFSAPSTGANALFIPSASVQTNSQGEASVTAQANNTEGTYNVTANYNGEITSSDIQLTNLLIPTSTFVSSSLNPSSTTDTVTFTVQVNSVRGAPTDGTIQISSTLNDGTVIPICDNQPLDQGQASCSTSALNTNLSYPIAATYNAGNKYKNSTSPTFIQSVATTPPPSTAPSEPRYVTAVPGSEKVTVNWLPPKNTGGLASSGITYTVTYGITDQFPYDTNVVACINISTTSCVIAGLQNGTKYTFKVIATNSIGTASTLAAYSNAVTPNNLSSTVSTLALSAAGKQRVIKLTNNDSGSIDNLNISYPGQWNSSQTPSAIDTCGPSLASQASCLIFITPGTGTTSNCDTGSVPISDAITISSVVTSNTIPVFVLGYNCQYQGGALFSIDDNTPAASSIDGKIVSSRMTIPAPSATAWSTDTLSIWGIDDVSTITTPDPNDSSAEPATLETGQLHCDGLSDGLCNSNNISAAGYTDPTYAAAFCSQALNGVDSSSCTDGENCYNDWYLPAICEIDSSLLGAVTCPADQQSIHTSISSISFLYPFWSSTQSSNNPSNNVWVRNNSGLAETNKTTLNGITRCVRNISN